MYRRWRLGLADHGGHGTTCADTDFHGISVECGEWCELNTDVEHNQRDELYCVWFVDRH